MKKKSPNGDHNYLICNMIKNYSLLSAAVLCVMAASCTSAPGNIATETRSYEDSTQYASLKVDIELPVAGKGAQGEIRNSIIGCLDDQLTRITTYENDKVFPSYTGDKNDTDALFGYYTSQAFSILSKAADDDVNERRSYMEENDEISPEQLSQMLEDIPGWEYQYSFKKTDETPSYVVFYSQNYIYMGGAHGGITGAGSLTFDKKDGHMISSFIDSTNTAAMQPLLREGLLQYYNDMNVEMTEDELLESLFIENGIIPLPSWQPYPTEKGLLFTYQQYEIASYAEGMPSFVLPFDKVAPYLTSDAKALLGL